MSADQPQECKDVEAAEFSTVLGILEQQQAFICKVYLIITIQLLLTFIVVEMVLISIHPLAYFLLSTSTGLLICLILSIIMIIAFCLSYCYQFANYLLLAILTTALGFLVGLACAAANGKMILESVMVTTAVVVNLTLYSFWGASRGHDFHFLMPFLLGSILLIMLFISVQIMFPLGRIFVMIYGGFGSFTFCGLIVCFTDSLILKNHCYNNYIWSAVCLYVEFMNLFLLLLTVLRALDC